ncbi:MAG: hypothetical protein ACM3SP_07355 [Chloroflexota bacterium]
MIRWFYILTSIFTWVSVCALSSWSWAIRLKPVREQLLINGPIEVGFEVKVQNTLAEHSTIRTVTPPDSPGENARIASAIGDMIRAQQIRTAVSGYCNSGCSRPFLGGTERLFTDDSDITDSLAAGIGGI